MPTEAALGDLSTCGAVVNLLKFLIGFGIISLPYATMPVGWLASSLGMIVVAALSVCGIYFAVMAREKLDALASDDASEEDPLMQTPSKKWRDTPEYGLGFFDKIVGHVLGRQAQLLFALCIAGNQFATIVIYVDTISTNIESYFDVGAFHVQVLLVLTCVLCLLSLVPTLDGVAVVSGFGLSLYVFLFAGLLRELLPKVASGTLPASVRAIDHGGIGEWFAMTCFAFGGFPIISVMYDEMRDRSAIYKVTSLAYSICWMVYASFGVAGYLCYGGDTRLLVYFNLEEGSIWRDGSAVALAAILTCSYVVQAMPLYNCTKNAFETLNLHEKAILKGVPPICWRWVVVIGSMVFAYMLPSMRFVLDTMGAISGVVSSCVFPCAVYLALSSKRQIKERILCGAVIVVGLLGLYCSLRAVAVQKSEKNVSDVVVSEMPRLRELFAAAARW